MYQNGNPRSHLIANRTPVKAVQDRMGHSRPDIVLRHYAQLLDETAIEAASLLSSKLMGKSKNLAKLKCSLTIQ